MQITPEELARRYAVSLKAYLARRDERTLQRAYELGREAVGAGLGVLDLGRAYSQAMATELADAEGAKERTAVCHLAGTFLNESLCCFEMTHRGFGEVNRMLRELNGVLENRARDLILTNETLKHEVAERKRAEAALRQSEETQRSLSAQVLRTQEEERKRISRELHDEVGQALTAINMNLAMLRKQVADQRLARKVTDSQEQLAQLMETIHSFTRELRPAMLDHLGLLPSLRAYVRNFRKRTGLRVHFRGAVQAETLGMEEKTVLYRVTQEGLTNVARHARARRADVLLQKTEDSIRMEIRDDGQALPPRHNIPLSGKAHLGLLGIQERVRLVDGLFALESIPGKGTTLRVQIPLKNSGIKSNPA